MNNQLGAVFIGWQDMWGEPAQPLFNITGPHNRSGSTVFASTLKELGITVPEVPTYDNWKKERAFLKQKSHNPRASTQEGV